MIDASNLAARCFHVAKRGRDDESVYGLARHGLMKAAQTLARQVDPLRTCVAMDGDHNFRKDLYPEYKGNRKEKDPELGRLMKEAGGIIQEAIGAEVYEAKNFEADDVIAALARSALPYGWRVVIASNDADLTQLLCDLGGGQGIYGLRSEMGAYHSIGPADVRAGKMGVPPLRVPLWKAIAGDGGDNIPGVKGLGPVAATRLANEFRTPAELFGSLDRLEKAVRTKLEAQGLEHLQLMLTLTTLRSDAPLTKCA